MCGQARLGSKLSLNQQSPKMIQGATTTTIKKKQRPAASHRITQTSVLITFLAQSASSPSGGVQCLSCVSSLPHSPPLPSLPPCGRDSLESKVTFIQLSECASPVECISDKDFTALETAREN